MITLYDFVLSGSCYKVRLLLSILKLPYKIIDVDFIRKEHKTEDFLKMNAFGELPVLTDGDLKLRDAQAILSYLARKYDPLDYWYPNDPAATGRINQWLSTGGNEIMSASGARLVRKLFYPMNLEALQARAKNAFRIMDAHLDGRDFLELGHPTIADIACFPYAAMAEEGEISLAPYPNLRTWIGRMKRIPGFIEMPGICLK